MSVSGGFGAPPPRQPPPSSGIMAPAPRRALPRPPPAPPGGAGAAPSSPAMSLNSPGRDYELMQASPSPRSSNNYDGDGGARRPSAAAASPTKFVVADDRDDDGPSPYRGGGGGGGGGGVSRCVKIVLAVQFALLLIAFVLIFYLLAASGGGGGGGAGGVAIGAGASGGKPLYDGIAAAPLSADAAALVAAPAADISADRVAALGRDEQFRVLVHLVGRALGTQQRATERIASALRYPGRDVAVQWDAGVDALPTAQVYAGDRLVFRYGELLDVVEFTTRAAYDACDVRGTAVRRLGDRYAGETRDGVVVPLDTAKTYYFGTSVHRDDVDKAPTCGGQRWAVTAAVPRDEDKLLAGAAIADGDGGGGGGGGGGGDAFLRLEVAEIKGVVQAITRHLVAEATVRESVVRSQGQSGVSRVRGYTGGTEPYHEGAFANSAILNIHNHAETYYTVGMGEINMVVNGVHSWTRHNDYNLNQPSTTDGKYHAYDRIEWPDVPPEVLACGDADVTCQIDEMRTYFRAWHSQDKALRDYTKYFKPVLAYYEAAWISDTDEIEEPFASDRHELNAKTWRQLQDRVRFLAASGRKDNLENLATLPSGIRDVEPESQHPIVGNYEYRIMAQPIPFDVELARFRVADDLAVQLRMSRPTPLSTLSASRRARFQLHPALRTDVAARVASSNKPYDFSRWPATTKREFVDELMELVPGKDNHGALLNDSAFGVLCDEYTSDQPLNTAYYSRYYQLRTKDAMGRSARRRSFNDPTLFAAMTTQKKVVPHTVVDNDGTSYTQRWTHAVPLEIVYLTPLGKWNPYKFAEMTPEEAEAGGRDGDVADAAKAYAGVSRKHNYKTPVEFFSDATAVGTDEDAADTSNGAVGVLDPAGTVRRVRASGVYVHLPPIDTVSDKPLRLRYPIVPVHEADSTAFKELKATQRVVFAGDGAFSAIRLDHFGITLLLAGGSGGGGQHTHEVSLNAADLATIRDANDGTTYVTETSTQANGHTHSVRVTFKDDVYTVLRCDSSNDACADGHNSLTPTL